MTSTALTTQIQTLATLPALFFADSPGAQGRMGANSALTGDNPQPNLSVLQQVLATCQQYGGQPISQPIDGALAYFSSAEQAVICASQIQIMQTGTTHASRIGIYIGDIQCDRSTVGESKNALTSLAAQLAYSASPGHIVLARTVYDVATSRLTLKRILISSSELAGLEPSGRVFAATMKRLSHSAANMTVFEVGAPLVTPSPSVNHVSARSTTVVPQPPPEEPSQPSTSSQDVSTPPSPNSTPVEPSLGDIFSPALIQSPTSDSADAASPTLQQIGQASQSPQPSSQGKPRSRPPQSGSNQTVPPPNQGAFGSRATVALSESCKDQLLSTLANHIGPMAALTISSAEASATSTQEFVELLLDVVPKQSRADFRRLAFGVMNQETGNAVQSGSHPWELL
ncbi:MAG: hypothetical protein AAGA40_10270 [Cyanobacteria bacterium P01_E01_bin.45]